MDFFRAAAFGMAWIILAGSVAGAETRLFVVANNPDGYGVDRCLATGARCGIPIANSYCQARDFAKAVSFRKLEPGEITGSGATACKDGCGEYVAIECGP